MKNLTFHENYIFYSSIQPNPYIPYFAMTQKVVCYWVELEPQKFNSEKQAKVLTLFPKSHSFSPVSSPFRPSKYLSWGTIHTKVGNWVSFQSCFTVFSLLLGFCMPFSLLIEFLKRSSQHWNPLMDFQLLGLPLHHHPISYFHLDVFERHFNS